MVSTRLLKTHAAGFAELNRLYASLYVTLFANLFSAFQALHFSKKLTKYTFGDCLETSSFWTSFCPGETL